MRRTLPLALLGLFLTIGVGSAQEPVAMKVEAPELEGITDWVNSKALKLGDLKGKVVVLHFWTFG
jgi:hypothetical protein